MNGAKRRPRRGHALVAMIVAIVLCGGLSAAVLTTNSGRERAAMANLASMKALNLAEAGADWAIAQVRIGHGVVPVAPYSHDVSGEGRFDVTYAQGNADGLDNNGDGVVDDAGEADLAKITCTGTSGGYSRTVEVLMRKAIETPGFPGAVLINVEAPVLDFNGNAFTIDGREHFVNGDADPDRAAAALYAISSPALVADLESQVASNTADQVTGKGGSPSISQAPAIDLDKLVDQAMQAANVLIEPGTHANMNLGTPTETGVVCAYCGGDLHLSGSSGGAGILCVDGTLEISGGFTWTGLVLVRGRVTMVGGGDTKRIIGALAVGEEVGSAVDTTTLRVTGTVDFQYSSDAIALASNALAITAVMSWREVGNPAP